MKPNIFTDDKGTPSMRRFLAFLLTLTSIGIGISSIVVETSWEILLVGIGIPLLGAIILLFFTTWSDIGNVLEKLHHHR